MHRRAGSREAHAERALDDVVEAAPGTIARPVPRVAPGRTPPAAVEVAIVGAGFAGIGMAIALRRAGIEDLAVLERAADVGGTWQANTYPGCQCDVPSTLYSFSFAPHAGWTRAYPEQPQIQAYLRDCAARFGVLGRTHTGCELLDARWDADAARWRIRTSTGELVARVLVAAPGLLSEPSVPPIPGLESFGGPVMHTAAWDHARDLTGRRVALIGTGASAIQVGPRLQPRVARLHVFQRTPPWILPHPDRPVGRALRRAYATVPGLQRLARTGVHLLRESLVPGLTRAPRLLVAQELAARALLRAQVRDPALRARLAPPYRFGCKRVLLSNDWYPMLQRANVELVTEAVAEIRDEAIVTRDGVARPVDAIVLATGFAPTDPPLARRLRDAGGRTLAETWNGSPQAHLGTSVAGFPNLFLLYGPNTNLGHSSIVAMLEAQVGHVVDVLGLLRASGARSVEVRADVQAAYNTELQRRLARSVWNTGGCTSWYLDARGRNSTMWPGSIGAFRRRAAAFDPRDHHLDHGRAP